MAKRLLMQSDDYGMTDAVSAGIRSAIEFGLIKNTGLFVNMASSERAVRDLEGTDICLGIDINYVCGCPVSDPADVPHLVDERRRFVSSSAMAARNKLVKMDDLGLISTFEEDPYPYEEILLETENQVKRFIDLTGKKPEYMHLHSLTTDNCYRAAREVAAKYGLFHSVDMMHQYRLLPGTFGGSKGKTLESQMDYDVLGNLLNNALPTMQEDETCYFICHCGYVDQELFRQSSLTLRRAKDLDAVRSPLLKRYIEDHGIELITYRDL